MTFNALNLVQNIDTSTLTDMTDTTTGGGGNRRPVLPKGTAFLVFTSYIEYGNHPQEFQGKAKDPAMEFRLGFHIVGGVGVNLEGEDEDYVQDGYCPQVHTFDTALSQNEKSRSVAYFNALNTKPQGTHYIHKLGTLYTVQITHGKNKKTGKDQHEIDFRNLQPAIDAATRKPYTVYTNAADEVVPLATVKPEDIKVFLWNKPPQVSFEDYQAMWNSIEIEGEYEVKDKDGKVTGKKSKNFLQEKCLKALNFAGSSLEQLLNGGGLPALDTDEVQESTAVVSDDSLPDIGGTELEVPEL